jgi:hypothetical protein
MTAKERKQLETELQERILRMVRLTKKAAAADEPIAHIGLGCDLKLSLAGTYSSTGTNVGVPSFPVPVSRIQEAFELAREITGLQLAIQMPEMVDALRQILKEAKA